MSRHAELERILQAWFDWENCSASEKHQYRNAFDALLDEVRVNSKVSRQELIIALADRYREFRAAKEREIRARLSRLH